MKLISSQISLLLITFIAISSISIKLNDKNLGKEGNYGVIDWDNYGYYVYLPAIFIYDDLKIQNIDWIHETQKKYNLSKSAYQVHEIQNGNRIVQYTSGMAILYSPAFFIGHFIAIISSYEADGFSLPYQIAVLVQSFLILFLGLFYLRKLARFYFSEEISSLLILIICLGTNFFQISFANVSSPHIYLFLLYAYTLYLIAKWHENPTRINSFLISLSCSLMILSRASEILFIIVPIFWIGGMFNTIKEKVIYLLENKIHLFIALIPLVIIGIIQPLYWNYATGEWLFDSYTNESFKLFKPYLNEYLFSFKKGWLLYTPIMIIGILGFVPVILRNAKIGIPLFSFLILYIWLLSSWDCWWYASSFSQRSIVQAYPIFVFPFGYFLKWLERKKFILKLTISLLLMSLIFLNLLQTYQFKKYILHPERMTKEYYWNSFFVLDEYKVDRTLLEPDRNISYLPDVSPSKHNLIHYNSFAENDSSYLSYGNRKIPDEGIVKLSKERPYIKNIKFRFSDLTDTSYCYLICRFRYKSDYDQYISKFGIEFRMIDAYNGKYYDYRRRGIESINWFEKGSWSSMDMVIIPSILRNENDSLQFNLVYNGNNEVLIDNVSIELYDYSSSSDQKIMTLFNDFNTIELGEWSKGKKLNSGRGFNFIDSLNPFSSTLHLRKKDLVNRKKVKFESKLYFEDYYSDTYMIVDISSNNESILYKSKAIKKEKENWEKKKYEIKLPSDLPNDSEIKIYLWNKSKGKVLIRHLKVDLE